MRIVRPRVVALLAVATSVATSGSVAASAPVSESANSGLHHRHQHWVASWTASPTDGLWPFDAAGGPVPEALTNQSLRMVIAPHLGGRMVRVHISNRFGRKPLTIGRVTVGHAETHAATAIKTVTFDHRRSVTIPVGHDAVSDPVRLRVRPFQSVAVSMYVPGVQSFPTKHWNANATSYYTPPGVGDMTTSRSGTAYALRTQAWLYVDGLDVRASRRTAVIVAFGDSITDGFVAANRLSEPVDAAIADKNGRYPDDLQRRLLAANIPLSVVNAGIGSNRLVTDGEPLMLGLSGLQRFREDALDVAGVKGVILQEGINDFGLPGSTTTPAQLIAGFKRVIHLAHSAGVRIWIGTLLPASNAFFDGTITAPKSERYRERANAWIRRQHVADGVIDFAARLRDPAHHHRLNPRYSGPDHLHPDLRGYRVMARVIRLSMLRTALA